MRAKTWRRWVYQWGYFMLPLAVGGCQAEAVKTVAWLAEHLVLEITVREQKSSPW